MEFPLRMIPLDALEIQDEDGFDLIVQTPTVNVAEQKLSRKQKNKQANNSAANHSQPLSQTASKSIYLLCFVNLNQI